MRLSTLIFFWLIILTSLSSCNKLEMIPVYQDDQNTESIENRLFNYKANHKFGEEPSFIKEVDKTKKSKTSSYIQTDIKTSFVKFKENTKHAWLYKLIKWLGLIAVILIAALGFFLIKPTDKKVQKRKNLFRIIISQFPLIAFLYFIQYSYLFIFLWFAILVVALIIGTSSQFKKRHLFVIPIALFLLAWCGYKAGPKVYIDNACAYPVSVQISGISSTLLPAKSHTQVRISSENPKVKVLANKNVIEKLSLCTTSNTKALLLQALFPWRKYIYNINGENTYQLKQIHK